MFHVKQIRERRCSRREAQGRNRFSRLIGDEMQRSRRLFHVKQFVSADAADEKRRAGTASRG